MALDPSNSSNLVQLALKGLKSVPAHFYRASRYASAVLGVVILSVRTRVHCDKIK